MILFSSIFLCYYMFRNQTLLIDFLLKKSHEMTLFQQRYVYWICVLNLNLAYRISISQTLISISHWHTTYSGENIGLCFASLHVKSLWIANRTICELQHRPICKLLWCICNFTKSNTPSWVFFTFFKLYKWYQNAHRITYVSQSIYELWVVSVCTLFQVANERQSKINKAM